MGLPTSDDIYQATGRCRLCGEDVIGAANLSNGKSMDLEPVPEGYDVARNGSFALEAFAGSTSLIYHPGKSPEGGHRYVAHAPRCKGAGEARTVEVKGHTRVVRPRRRRDDPEASAANRDAGTAAVSERDDAYQDWARKAITTLARVHSDGFTSDDLEAIRVADNGPTPRHTNGTGAAFNSAARAGIIVATGWKRTTLASGHARKVTVWGKGPKA